MPESAVDVAADARRVAILALAEDGVRDVSSLVSVGADQRGRGVVEMRAPVVIAGLAYADAVIAACGLPPVLWRFGDGHVGAAGGVLGVIEGDLRAIMRAERPLLNLLQRACGIATLTAEYVNTVAGTRCRILHTRKTTPGLRTFEIAAVLAGGGLLHRRDLSQQVMIKDNHWAALAQQGLTLAQALDDARSIGVTSLQVEVEQVEQVDEACAAGATRLLIDNQHPRVVAEWVTRAKERRPGIECEATGGITLQNAKEYARAGADFISIGALTHSVPSADLGLEIAQAS